MAEKKGFVVRHKEPKLLVPAKPTAHEIKQLSDIDDQKGLRMHFHMIMFYRANPLVKGKDPVEVIRDALAEALVWYYPLAGRLVQGLEDKFMVDCSGEGILFVEADSNFSLEDLGDAIKPPCLYYKELLYRAPGSEEMLGCPLMLVQVTRLICGGFVVAIRINHVLSDGLGLAQFVKAVEELAQGAPSPSIKPLWGRETLTAKHLLLQTTYDHPEYNVACHKNDMDDNNLFDLITACIWRARTRALDLNGDQTTSVVCTINVRDKGPPALRDGYYGNAVVFPAAVTEARRLYDNPLDYAVKLIEEAKGRANEDYIRSMVNFMSSKGRPPIQRSRSSFIVTDLSRLGFSEMDFGWGKPVYGGTMEGERSATIIAHALYRNSDGEDGIVVPVFLPPPAMKRFEEEMKKLIALMPGEVIERPSKLLLKSTL
nr:methanol O-anthraniloyltransferase-like [Ipomoea batatas]